ncbi:hypothetical protein HUJ04_011329 [Dendroctonus ponderosae]|nr:hypothetical protein HUJ04_011329 [Dendroctonus ponderosae]
MSDSVIQTVEKAMSPVIEEENFLYSQNRGNAPNTQCFKPNQRMKPSSQFSQPKPLNYQHNQIPNLTNPFKQQNNNNFNFPKPFNPNFQFRSPLFQPRETQVFRNPFMNKPNRFVHQRQPQPYQRPNFPPRQSQVSRNPFMNNPNRFVLTIIFKRAEEYKVK